MLAEHWPQVPRVALTATANAQTRQEIAHRLGLEDAAQFVASFDRPNIFYQMVEKKNTKEQLWQWIQAEHPGDRDRKSTRLNSSHVAISYAVFCLKKKKKPP